MLWLRYTISSHSINSGNTYSLGKTVHVFFPRQVRCQLEYLSTLCDQAQFGFFREMLHGPISETCRVAPVLPTSGAAAKEREGGLSV